jgi:parallel beta-helix repeat protein
MRSKTVFVITILLFLALGTIATVSSVHALRKWKPTSRGVINVADYPSIQDAVDSLPATGGTVFIPAGLYLISSPVKLPSNVALTGEGFDTILKLADGANTNVIENMNLGTWTDSNIVITNMQIDGNGENQTGPANGIFLYAAPNSRIEQVWAHNFPRKYLFGIQVSAAIHVMFCPNTIIQNNVIEDNKYSGIFVSFSDNNVVYRNRIYDSHRGIYLRNSDNVSAAKNTVINCDEGIRIYYDASYNEIIGNYIEGSSEEGIVVTHQECSNNVISRNTLVNNVIQINDQGSGTRISHNRLTYT